MVDNARLTAFVDNLEEDIDGAAKRRPQELRDPGVNNEWIYQLRQATSLPCAPEQVQ